MSENIENTVVDSTEPTEQVEQKPVSKYEEQALAMGWRPQTEWEGDEEDFVSAKEFVQRKSFFDKISTQSGEIRELKKTLNEFSEHFRKVEDYTRKQVLDELKASKRAALEEGDTDEVIRIDEAITDFKLHEKELEKQKEAEKAKKEAPTMAPEYVRWKEANAWYQTDAELTQYADMIARGYVAANQGVEPEKVFALVEREVKARFPDKFKNKKREAPAAVESGSGGAKPKPEKLQATEAERATARRFVKMGIYKSEDDYIKELRKLDGGE